MALGESNLLCRQISNYSEYIGSKIFIKYINQINISLERAWYSKQVYICLNILWKRLKEVSLNANDNIEIVAAICVYNFIMIQSTVVA